MSETIDTGSLTDVVRVPKGTPPAPLGLGRREHIARAAVSVIAEHGVEGLTHRRVAETAQVPLGSTTYYFKTLDELLEIGSKQAMDDNIDDLRRWADALEHEDDIVEAAVALVVRRASEERARTVLYYELYVASFRRPALRKLCVEWTQAFVDVFTRHFDRPTARSLSAVLDGLILEAVITGTTPSPREVREVVTRVLAGP